MGAIEEMCEVSLVSFSVGDVQSTKGENMDSAKILSFAKLLRLSQDDTLQLFGTYYRDDVLSNPGGTNHPNIRAFISGGWDAVSFPEGLACRKKGA